jgi:hypothetical protein
MGLFGCGPAVFALTTGLPLPINLGGHRARSKRCSGPAVAAWAQVTPWIERGSQFVVLVEDRARDGCHPLLAFYDFPAEHWKHLRTSETSEPNLRAAHPTAYREVASGKRPRYFVGFHSRASRCASSI